MKGQFPFVGTVINTYYPSVYKPDILTLTQGEIVVVQRQSEAGLYWGYKSMFPNQKGKIRKWNVKAL